MRKKELLSQIDELNAKVERLEECIKTQDRLIEGYQKRERAVIGALDTVESSVSRRLRDAEEQAEKVRSEAETESKRFLKEVEMRSAELNERITSYNALLERSAADAARNAEFFSVFAKDHILPAVETKLAAGGVTPLLEPETAKTEAASDPKRLMQAIYTIENRDLPESKPEPPQKHPEPLQKQPEPGPERSVVNDEPDDEPLAPKVSELVGKKGNETGEDTSLEALLNEIIQTGDIL